MLFTEENTNEEYYYTSNEGCKIKLLERKGNKALIEFQDEIRFKKWVGFTDLQKGRIKNPFYPSICGIAYLGDVDRGTYTQKEKQKFINIINDVRKKNEKLKENLYCFKNFLMTVRILKNYNDWHNDTKNMFCLTTRKTQDVIDNFIILQVKREEFILNARSKAIVIVNMFSGETEYFESLTACAKEFDITPQTVGNYARKNKECDGCIFYYASEYNG